MRRRWREWAASGRFWQRFWLSQVAAWVAMIGPSVTVLSHSIPYLIFISVWALVLGCASSFQASLSMRKADPDDPM